MSNKENTKSKKPKKKLIFELLGFKDKHIGLKQPAILRAKRSSSNKESLYLDLYVNGVRSYEFLRLYLDPNKTANENKEVVRLAEKIRIKRLDEINSDRFEIVNKNKKKYLLLDEFQKFVSSTPKKQYRITKGNVLKHLSIHFPKKTTLWNFGKSQMNDFVEYLKNAKSVLTRNGKTIITEKPLSQNTINTYAGILSSFFQKMVLKELIKENPFKHIDRKDLKRQETKIEYLTIEEVQRLINNQEKVNPDIAKAFLFSVYTGLRGIEVSYIKGKNIKNINGVVYLELFISKSKKNQKLKLTKSAINLLPEKFKDEDFLFNLNYSKTTINKHIKRWIKINNIDKKITYHCSRHSNATILLNNGVDLKTVSEMLSHSSVAMTERYAKVIQSKKDEASDIMNQIF